MFAVALLVGTLTALAGARIYERCELARDLQLLGVDRDQIATWVCIAYHESRYDTAAQNYGSGDHGLLQISQLYWCGPGKACGAPCSAFRDEDIADDVKCALQIHKEHTRLQGDGFLAWVVYPHFCKQNAKKYIVDCDKNLKNTPVKFDDRARYFKASSIKNEAKSQVVSTPYRNAVTPRYLSINSIFQGSYVNDEFEKKYYDNDKTSNWLDFKVDNIDDLKLPGVVSENQRSRFIEFTTRPTTTKTLDPALIGIKPPSPRKIESNQFRRKKTFAEPLFLKNRISDVQETSQTTPSPVRDSSKSTLSFNEDLSQNIFLNLSPSVISKSLREFPSIKSNDFSRYHVKTSPEEESSSSTLLTYDDLAQNPFLNSLPGFNFKSRTESPFRATDFSHNNFRGYTLPTLRPVASLESSKQVGPLRNLDVDSNIPESSKTSSQINEDDTKISIADLAQNPFLSHLLRVNNIDRPTDSTIREFKLLDGSKNYEKDFTFTTMKPISESVISSSKDFISHKEQLEISTKNPRTVQRGRERYLSDFDNTNTEKPSTERSTTVAYSTRHYQTISRRRPSANQYDFKSTTAVESSTEKPKVSTTAKPYTNEFNWRNHRIETTTSKAITTIASKTLYNVLEVNKVAVTQQKEYIPQTTSKPENTRKSEITRRPEITSRLRTVDRTETTTRPQIINRLQTTGRLDTTSRPQISNRTETARRLQIPSRSQTGNSLQITSRSETTGSLQTTSKPQTTRGSQTMSRSQTTNTPQTTRESQTTKGLQTTSGLQSTSRPLEDEDFPVPWIRYRPQTTSKPQTTSAPHTTRGPQATSRPLTTNRPLTTSRLLTTSRPLITSRPLTTRGPQTTRGLQPTSKSQATSKPQTTRATQTTRGLQTTSRPQTLSRQNISIPETTNRPTTLRPWSFKPFWEESRNYTSTTPRSSFTWRRPTTSTLSSTTRYSTTTQKPLSRSTEASTARTTLSIFDLYLRPSTPPPFKPFEFSSSNRKLSKVVSIFSGGTTKPPPGYYTSKKTTPEEVLKH